MIRGKGPKRGRVILKKRFMTETSPVLDVDGGTPGDVIRFKDKLRTVARIRMHGRFRYRHQPLDPARRRPREGRQGRRPAQRGAALQRHGDHDDARARDAETDDPSCWNDHPIMIPDEPGRDNAEAVVRIDWATPPATGT